MSQAFDEIFSIMRQLRDPDTGCPWDREQDFQSIAPHTIEEEYEVADAIAKQDYEGLRDELGDLPIASGLSRTDCNRTAII